MIASNDLILDYEPETNTSSISEDVVFYLGDRRKSASNTTIVFYKTFSTLSESARQMIARAKSFNLLQHNWDSHGAVVPSSENIERAISFIKQADKNLLPFYFTAPGPNGEIVVEFRKGNKEAAAYFNPDGTSELVMNEGDVFIEEGTIENNYKDLLHFINA
jgi:hypothetical protein